MRNRITKLAKQKKTVDRKLLFLIITFVAVGLIAVVDASAPQALNNYGNKFFLFKEQVISALIGIVFLTITANIKYTFWEKLATPIFAVSLVFMIVVLLPHIGFSALGAKRWISIGPVNFQPSELVKFAMCLYFAKVASKNKGLLSYFIPLVIVVGLIMLQPDLGTTSVVVVIALAQIFVSGINLWFFFGSAILGLLAGIPLILLSPYRRERVLTFMEMTRDPLGSSYHIKQILLALGSGGIFGVGLGASRQKYLFLPEASTDSIFAVLAEELGFIGGAALIVLFIYFVIRTLNVSKNAPDVFSKVLATGIAAWIGGQFFFNIAAMVALVPLTGIPLPFISYGGSSLVMILTACGILLNISKYSVIEAKNEGTKRR